MFVMFLITVVLVSFLFSCLLGELEGDSPNWRLAFMAVVAIGLLWGGWTIGRFYEQIHW